MQFNNVIINAPLSDILTTLRTELLSQDVDVFSVTKENGNNIQTTCPFHKGGRERKPSFGINVDNGACNCFTCGWKGYLPYLVGTLFKRDEEYGLKWLTTNFNSNSIEHRAGINLPSRNTVRPRKKVVEESALDTYRYTHPYMYQRGLSDYVIGLFDVGYDKDSKCITFPVKDLSGDVVFVARRSVSYKYFNYPSGVDKPVYGAYLFTEGKYKKCYIVESFFNCLTLWKLGLPAVALMGTGTKEQYTILDKLPVREYVIALDPDEAGRLGTVKLRKYLSGSHIIKEIVYTDDRDVNDLQEEFLELPEVF